MALFDSFKKWFNIDKRQDEDWELMRQFFGAHFHQDWTLDSETVDDVLLLYAKDASKEKLRRLANAIIEFEKRIKDDKELDMRLINELWCDYCPTFANESTRIWLREVAARLRELAEAAKR